MFAEETEEKTDCIINLIYKKLVYLPEHVADIQTASDTNNTIKEETEIKIEENIKEEKPNPDNNNNEMPPPSKLPKDITKMEEEDDEIDPLDAYMAEVHKEAIKDILAVQQIPQIQYEPSPLPIESKPIPTVTLEEIENDHKTTSEDEQELGDDEYYEKFKEALAKKKEEEAKKCREILHGTKKNSDDGLGLIEADEGGVEEIFEEEGEEEPPEEQSALEMLKEKMKKKEIKEIDQSKIDYIPIRKNLYIPTRSVQNMTEDEIQQIRNKENIKIRGSDCPAPITEWEQGGFIDSILNVIKKYNYSKPFPIQQQSMPVIMSGRDIIAVAKTGSGKTLAFLLPMIRHILDQPPLQPGDGPIAVIMAPARELAVQIYNEAKKFCKVLGLKVTAVYGGAAVSEQISSIKRGSEIVVCTPGRMIDMLCMNNSKLVPLNRVSYVVLDEADRMFDMGFEPQVKQILKNIRKDRQVVMFSATFPDKVEKLAKNILKKPIEIIIGGRTAVAPEVEQIIEIREKNDKWNRLLQILGENYTKGSILIFCDTQDKCDTVYIYIYILLNYIFYRYMPI